MIGQVLPVREDSLDVQLYYEHPNCKLFLGDSIEWLKSLANDSVDLVFADPPYNIKKTEWDTFESQEAYIEWSIRWIKEAARVLKNTGSLYICGFSEILADLKHPASRYFHSSHWLIWSYRNKANLGQDWGRSHESILHFRKSSAFALRVDDIRIPYGNHTLKYPVHPQATTSQQSSNPAIQQSSNPNNATIPTSNLYRFPFPPLEHPHGSYCHGRFGDDHAPVNTRLAPTQVKRQQGGQRCFHQPEKDKIQQSRRSGIPCAVDCL